MDKLLKTMMDSVRALSHRYGTMEREIGEKYGLSSGECAVLAFLHNNPSLDTQSDIAEGRHMLKSNVSMYVSVLEEKGLLIRRHDEKDRRIVHLEPSAAAFSFLSELDGALSVLSSEAFSGFLPSEKDVLEHSMLRIRKNIRGEYGKR